MFRVDLLDVDYPKIGWPERVTLILGGALRTVIAYEGLSSILLSLQAVSGYLFKSLVLLLGDPLRPYMV